jgi:hypothetical protein
MPRPEQARSALVAEVSPTKTEPGDNRERAILLWCGWRNYATRYACNIYRPFGFRPLPDPRCCIRACFHGNRKQKEVDHYASVLVQLQAAGDLEGVQRVQEQPEDAEAKLADAEDNALNTRAGYVYVISNLGAFGEGVVKIGMTRRLSPMERVRELGDASVPFLFDVHALSSVPISRNPHSWSLGVVHGHTAQRSSLHT